MDLEDKYAARVVLNQFFREVVKSVQQRSEHAAEFNQSVQVENVEDYLVFVDPSDATVCLEQILSRTRSCFYTSVSQFRGDFERLLANAMAYNSPGHGRHAYKPIIDWAQELLDTCCEELEARHKDILDAEKRLKDAMEESLAQTEAGSPKKELAISSLEALIAACELAAEQEGLKDQRSDEQADQPNIGLLPPFLDMTFDESMGTWPFIDLPLMQLDMTMDKPNKKLNHYQGGKHPSSGSRPQSCKGNDSASRYRRHKSKVFIRPNKVVYLPTTFMEENFDASSLPVNCLMIVETNGVVQPEPHTVTIKSVPRQGLSTMYCMTNVMKFQQQFLNWQILDWTKVDSDHIKIHLQNPSGEGGSKMPVDDSPMSATAVPKRKGNVAVYDDSAAAAAEDEEDGLVEAPEDGDSNPEAPHPQRFTGRSASAKSARTSMGRKAIPQDSDSSSPSLQDNHLEGQQGCGVDPLMDIRSHEDRLSPSNSSGAISDTMIQPAGRSSSATAAAAAATSGIMSQQQIQQLMMAQMSTPQLNIAMQLQYQQALAAVQQQQFAQQQLTGNGNLPFPRVPIWGVTNATVDENLRQQQLFQLQLQQQQQLVKDDTVRQTSALSFPSNSGLLPDVQQQSQTMLLLQQIMAGNTTNTFGSAPTSGVLRMGTALDSTNPEVASAFKKYKFGSQGSAIDTAVFAGPGTNPVVGGLGLMSTSGPSSLTYGPIAVALLAQQQQMLQQQEGSKRCFEGVFVPPPAVQLQQSFSM